MKQIEDHNTTDNLPDEQTSDNQKTAGEIINGANNEDQLDQLNNTVTPNELENYPDNQTGTPPSTGDEHLEASKNTELSGKHIGETQKGYDQKSAGDIGQFTPTTGGDYHDLEENMGGTTNLSLDQLKQEGDINNPDEEE